MNRRFEFGISREDWNLIEDTDLLELNRILEEPMFNVREFAVFYLYVNCGESYAKLSKSLSMDETTVRKMMANVIKKLKELLKMQRESQKESK